MKVVDSIMYLEERGDITVPRAGAQGDEFIR